LTLRFNGIELDFIGRNKPLFPVVLNRKIEIGQLLNAMGHMMAGLAGDLMKRGHGGYDDATRTVVGSDGNYSACREVMEALGVNGLSLGSTPFPFPIGCVRDPSGATLRVYFVTGTTTAGAAYVGYRRACACSE